jgi:hypothetical protein
MIREHAQWAVILGLLGWIGVKESRAGTQEESTTQPPDSLTYIRTVTVPVGVGRNDDGTPAKTIELDTYKDWDFGTVAYVSEGGSVSMVPATPNWQFRTDTFPNGGMTALCFQPGTGLSYLLDAEGNWKLIEEPTVEGKEDQIEIQVGDYDVSFAVDGQFVYAMRADLFTGRSWKLFEDSWVPIPGNLADWPTESEEGK